MNTSLLESLRNGPPTHAILISGYNEKALADLAMEASGILLCSSDSSQKPCGRCKSCELFKSGNHPDFIKLFDPKSIKIDPVRDLISAIAVAPRYGRRVVWIENAQRMTPQAQNALLKTLEEPPEGNIFLLTGQEAGLLPTVRSRCMILRTGMDSGVFQDQEAVNAAKRMAVEGPFSQYSYYRAFIDVPEKQKQQARSALLPALETQAGVFLDMAVSGGEKASAYIKCAQTLIEARKRAYNGNLNMVVDWLMIKLKDALL